jgi:hypothetical protein
MKIKFLFIAAFILAVAASSGFAQSKTKIKASDIRSVDFLNYSFRPPFFVGVGNTKTVKLRRGEFKDNDLIYSVAKDDIVYGDVNGDGTEDAVVQIRLSSGASLRAFEIHVYTPQKNGAAKLLARLDSDRVQNDYQKIYPDAVMCCAGGAPKIKKGYLIVEALTDGLFLNPENTATFNYKLSGNKFVLTGKPTKKPIK